MSRTSPVTETLPEWEDADVQLVYEMLCDPELNSPPNPEEHWEGWVSRNIVRGLRSRRYAQCPDQMDGVDQAGARALVLENAKLREQLETWKNAERGLSASYVRLRHLIPGALETPTAPTPEQVWDTTERALERFVDRIASASPDTSTTREGK
jgi:hypothetical protein